MKPARAERGYIDREVWNRAGEVGLLSAPAFRKKYGGGGGNFAHEAVICIEMARAIAAGLGNGVRSGIVAHYLLNYGTEAQKLQIGCPRWRPAPWWPPSPCRPGAETPI
ncbi:acyl-CoA dehydrogenase family protein [Cupriavidus basilensis]